MEATIRSRTLVMRVFGGLPELGAAFPELQQLQGAPCKSAPRTQKESGHRGGRPWAGAGTLRGTCRSVRGCPHHTRGRSAHTRAHSCLPAQQAGRDACLASPVPIQGSL